MTNHYLTLFKMKSELLDLISGQYASLSYQEWFNILSEKLRIRFGIRKMDFLIHVESGLSPLNGYHGKEREYIEIPFRLINEYETESKRDYLNLFKDSGYKYADDLLIFSNSNLEPLGILLIEPTEEWRSFASQSNRLELEKIVSYLLQNIRKTSYLVAKERKYRQLFNVTELFNSTMDSQVILDGIIEAIKESFPLFTVELLLSHDQKELTDSYKLFDYLNERASTIDSFISGELTVEDLPDSTVKLINTPIKGRQGMYGVLQIKAPLEFVFSKTQRNFIRMLANTAGSALENANLYDQSFRLISDLQLVNETSRKLNSNMDFGEMVAYLKVQLLKAFRPSEIAFVFYDEDGNWDSSPMNTEFFQLDSGQKYIQFASSSFKERKEGLFEAKFSSTISKPVEYESIIAIPIMNQDQIVGFVICLHENSYFFSFESYKLMQSLIGHSSLALANSMLRDQLRELANKDHLTKLYARRFIEKAIGKSLDEDERGVLILLDLDDFKTVNDTYGHEAGDEVLRQTSTYIITELADKGIAARWGGEELAIYLPNYSEKEGELFARQLAENLPLVTDPSVTVSGGLKSWTSDDPIRFQELFHFVDKALYIAKDMGKNQIVKCKGLFIA
ncbi:sensor domain-containing diguanylate cyclase [Sporosarcina sp. CAU 1771]